MHCTLSMIQKTFTYCITGHCIAKNPIGQFSIQQPESGKWIEFSFLILKVKFVKAVMTLK